MSRAPQRGPILGLLTVLGLGAFAWTSTSNSAPAATRGVDGKVLAWNDLGMHCIDPDFSLFSILPPFNTVNAQVIVDGELLDMGGGYTVTYEAVAARAASPRSACHSAVRRSLIDH